jgi:hypothetical protein
MAFGTKSNAALATNVTATATQTAVEVGAANFRPAAALQIAQVGTATTAATVVLQASVDGGTTYSDVATRTAGLAAATYSWVSSIPDAVSHVRTVFTEQSGGTSSTLNAQLGRVASA